jgi:hypothetical protein
MSRSGGMFGDGDEVDDLIDLYAAVKEAHRRVLVVYPKPAGEELMSGIFAKEMHMESTTRTKDIGYAAFLLTELYKLVRIEREGTVVHWVFDLDGDDGDALKASYFDGSATVSAKAYSSALRDLKSSLHR